MDRHQIELLVDDQRPGTARKQLAQLEAGDVVEFVRYTREWLQIIRISPATGAAISTRDAVVARLRPGWSGPCFPLTLHDYKQGWTVRQTTTATTNYWEGPNR